MDVPAVITTAKSKESAAFCAPPCSVKDDYIGKSRISSLGGSSGGSALGGSDGLLLRGGLRLSTLCVSNSLGGSGGIGDRLLLVLRVMV